MGAGLHRPQRARAGREGLADIAAPLARPGTAVSAVELVAAQADGTIATGVHPGDVFDERARRELRARLTDLDDDIAEAEAHHDDERAARAHAERDALVDAVAAATGFGGRSRRLDDPVERARKTVTARIRNSIERVQAVHPELAHHLDRSIDTGAWCTYRPEQPVSWSL